MNVRPLGQSEEDQTAVNAAIAAHAYELASEIGKSRQKDIATEVVVALFAQQLDKARRLFRAALAAGDPETPHAG